MDKAAELFDKSVTISYLTIGGISAYLGKRIMDYGFSAVLEKYTKSIKSEVSVQLDPIKDDIESLRKDINTHRNNHHGVIQKNEGVLLEAMHTLEDYNNQLKKKDEK